MAIYINGIKIKPMTYMEPDDEDHLTYEEWLEQEAQIVDALQTTDVDD